MIFEKKLVYLTLEAPRQGHAAYAHVHEIIGGLRRRGWDVVLYQPSYADKAISPSLPLRVLHALWLQARLWAGRPRGSVIYVRAHYLAFPTAVLARIFRVPIFHEINGPYDDLFITYPSLLPIRSLLTWMQRSQYIWASGLISVTPSLCNWVSAQSGGRHVQLISNGANTEIFHLDHPRPEGSPEKYVVFFGGLARWHRIEVLLRAFAEEEWPSDVDLVIIGDGPEKPLVDAAAAKNPRIHVLGRVPYTRIAPYVAHALCGVVITADAPVAVGAVHQASGKRGDTGLFPLKLFETLACGRPVIVTDFPGQADLVREFDCGMVISPDDAHALAMAVLDFNRYPEKAESMGQRGVDAIRRFHSWDKRADETASFLKEKLI